MIVVLKNFVDLTKDEIKLVWNERNSEKIRKQMYNSEFIPFENHIDWIKNLKNKCDRKYFLVFFDKNPVGVIDFTDIDNYSCEIGDYLFEKYLSSGYGILFEYIILKYAFEVLDMKMVHCAVLDSNKSVYDVHIKYFGFSKDEKYSSKNEEKGLIFNGLSLTQDSWKNWKNPFVEKCINFYKVERIKW